MKPAIVFLLLIASVAAVPRTAAGRSYDGYKVYRVTPTEDSQVSYLSWLENNGKFDFWTPTRKNGPVDIMAGPENAEELEGIFKKLDVSHQIFLQDVERKIQEVRSMTASNFGPKSTRYSLAWDNYYPTDVIHEFVYALATDYPNLVTAEVIGQSYEGRDLVMAKVSSGGDGTKPAIFVDGTFHAREWITPATVTFIMRELVENYAAHPELVDNVDWYFVPIVNPDGYEWTRIGDRLWRKTRAPTQDICTGTDPNRNFDFHWSEEGASSNSCSETYYGDAPFSEVETQALRDQLLKYASQIKMYVSLHSYSQMLLLPYGYTTEQPPNYAEHFAIGQEAIAALTAVAGTAYQIGSSSNLLYISSGLSKDWAYAVAGIPYSYVIELPDTGVSGFLLPPTEIIPVGTETWEAFKVFAQKVSAMK